MTLEDALAAMPIVAILRGIRTEEAAAVGEVLVASGIVAIEVPLNSPEPFASIERLAGVLGQRAAVGAGTVLEPGAVREVAAAGGSFIVAPDTRGPVVRTAVELGLEPVPGFATPTEALRGIRHGARFLKLFPAGAFGIAYIGALRAVLPAATAVIAVGGVDSANAAEWLGGGAAAVGAGSSLYRPGMRPGDTALAAHRLVATVQQIR